MICAYGCLDENPKDQVDPEAIYNNADNIYKAYTIITRSPQTRR